MAQAVVLMREPEQVTRLRRLPLRPRTLGLLLLKAQLSPREMVLLLP